MPKKPIWWLLIAGGIAVVVLGAWMLRSLLREASEWTTPPEDDDKTLSSEQARKIYGVRPLPPKPPPSRPRLAAASPQRKTPERRPYVPPRVRYVLRPKPLMPPPNYQPFPPQSDLSFYRLKREEFARWANLPLAEQGARFRPYLFFGRPQGMIITEVEPNSFYERLRLYKNDILLKVNGRPVIAPGQARRFYQEIARRSRNFTLEIIRGGKRKIVDFSLKP